MVYEGQNASRESESKNFFFTSYIFPNLRRLGLLFFFNRHLRNLFAFYTKMGLIKDRNGMDLTEAEYIKKRWQE